MKQSFPFHLLCLLLAAFSHLCPANGAEHPSLSVYSYTPAGGLQPNATYSVSVRSTAGGEWQTVPVWNCEVDMHHRSVAAFAQFDMEGSVELRVKLEKPSALAADSLPPMVRPASAAVDFSISEEGTLLHLTLQKPEYISVEFGGDRHHNLHIFANPMLKETYTGEEENCINWNGGGSQQDVFVKDARLIYFAPGLHRPKDLPGEDIRIPSNCTVYLAPGSVVQARLVVDHAENVRIIGRGILDHPLRGIEVTHSKNVLIDGITVLNPRHYTVFGGASSNISIRNLKTFSAGSWTDGIDLMSCHEVDIENVFLRTSDDCLAFYAHRWWYWGDAYNIRVKRATLWCDFAHPVNNRNSRRRPMRKGRRDSSYQHLRQQHPVQRRRRDACHQLWRQKPHTPHHFRWHTHGGHQARAYHGHEDHIWGIQSCTWGMYRPRGVLKYQRRRKLYLQYPAVAYLRPRWQPRRRRLLLP